MSDTPSRPPSSRDAANSSSGDSRGSQSKGPESKGPESKGPESKGSEKPLPADNLDTKNVVDGSSGPEAKPGKSSDAPPSQEGRPDRSQASRPDEQSRQPGNGAGPNGKDAGKQSDKNAGNTGDKQNGKSSSPSNNGGKSGKKSEKGPRRSKDSQKPETKGEKRAGEAGKAAGKEAGRAAGASVAGPAGAAVGEKIGGKLGEAAGKKAFKKLKKRLAPLAFLAVAFLMFIVGLVGANISLSSATSGRASANIGSSTFLNPEPITAMRKAVLAASTDESLGGEIPWGLLAGISLVSTETGKLSPYPEDLCDRNPEQKPLRTKTGLSLEACKDSSPTVYPVVSPPIGPDSPGKGQGPYLLLPSGVPDEIDLQSFAPSGSSATVWLVREIDRVRRELVDKEGWVLDSDTTEEKFVSFWGTVISRLPLADPNATTCVTPVLPERSDANTMAVAIAQVWRCRLSSSVFFHYDIYKKQIDVGAIDAVLRDALKVAYAWSQYGTSNNGLPPGCQTVTTTNTDGTSTTSVTEIPGALLAGVFPLTSDVFSKHKPSPTDTRCAPGANILAAVDAFLSVESLSWDERTGSDGEKIAGGWTKIPWALGDRETIADFYKNGPLLPFDPAGTDKACADALSAWVDSLKNSRTLDPAAGLLLTSDQSGTPTEIQSQWPSIKSALSTSDPRSRNGQCRGRTDGSVERYAASLAFDRQVVKELLHDDHSSHASEQSESQDNLTQDTTPIEPIDSIPPISDTPVEQIPSLPESTVPAPMPSPDDISYAGVRSVLEFLARYSASDAQVEAIAGKDSLILRASPNGREFSGVPYPAVPSSGRLLTVIKLARTLSGLWEQDPMFDSSASGEEIDSALQEALPSFAPGGVSIGSVPYALLDATQKAAVAVKKWFPQCTADAGLLLGVAWTESRGSWTTIGPDGNMTPRMVHGGSIASPPVDNDNGVFDGDPNDDHAVGAFGSAPGTWIGWKWRKSGGSWVAFEGRETIDATIEATWSDAGYGKGSDGNADGVSDPNNVYDAAIATIRNLCAGRGALDLVNWSEDFIQAFGVYVGGGDWDSTTATRTCYKLPPIVALRGNPNDNPDTDLVEVTKRQCSEVLIRMKWDKAQEFRAMLSGAASFSSAGVSAGGSGVVAVPPELLALGNGRIPQSLLTPVGIGSETLYGPAATAFISMRQTAKDAGIELWINGSYRSYEGQISCARRKGTSDQNQWMIQNNETIPPAALPNGWCAIPGRSNHGWGLAIDLGTESYPCGQGSPCWSWMINNARRFGWCDTGGGPREPWHWQFVGAGQCPSLFGSKPPL